MAITLGSIAAWTVTLPGDMQWSDEFAWLPSTSLVEIACNGALLVEESAQLAGRPITLEGRMESNVGFALPNRATVIGLLNGSRPPTLLSGGDPYMPPGASSRESAATRLIPDRSRQYAVCRPPGPLPTTMAS